MGSGNVQRVVLISSMGGTRPEHCWNAEMQGLVLWKRKAECYLMESGISYSILHAGQMFSYFGGMMPDPGGRRELVVALNDSLLDDRSQRVVSREDVAEVCIQCAMAPDTWVLDRSFDLGSGLGASRGAVDMQALLAPLQGAYCTYSEQDADFRGLPATEKRRQCLLC